jgi:hypothetical protein
MGYRNFIIYGMDCSFKGMGDGSNGPGRTSARKKT